MKISFLCGSLEPGREGVGDYTRRLAVQLIQQGHDVSAIALNDTYLLDAFRGNQSLDGVLLPVFRIPSYWTSSQKFHMAKAWLDELNPDWLSLQFVLFSFNPKGLPFGLVKRLKSLGYGKPWHIMFHELWVGMEKKSGLKLRMWGRLQRWIIKSLTTNLQPLTIHTQTKLYQLQLAKIGIDAEYLPLFSNIPVIKVCPGTRAKEAPVSLRNTIELVLFGEIHAGAPIEDFALEISSFARENDKKFNLNIVGRSGIEQDRWAEIWKSFGLSVKLLGEQSAENISKILRSCTFGISTNPIALAEKSGTIAAMLEHGLPVICVRNSWMPRGLIELSYPHGVVEYQAGCLNTFFERKFDIVSNNTVANIALKFAEDLLRMENSVKGN